MVTNWARCQLFWNSPEIVKEYSKLDAYLQLKFLQHARVKRILTNLNALWGEIPQQPSEWRRRCVLCNSPVSSRYPFITECITFYQPILIHLAAHQYQIVKTPKDPLRSNILQISYQSRCGPIPFHPSNLGMIRVNVQRRLSRQNQIEQDFP
ncbi:hypothetical protein TNCV_1688641 [Trichonephila clavipes]|nr:hypothetical protein TNCV_1688641 [Trichonephila clavipes]